MSHSKLSTRHIILTLALCFAPLAYAGWLGNITQAQAGQGMREALLQSALTATQKLGVLNGFLGNPQVKIPLPANLQKVEKLMRLGGMGKQADSLITTMNRAAEQAVPEAKSLFVAAIKQMTVQDAKAILVGGDDAATQFFKRTTTPALTQKFLPIVSATTNRLQLARQYNIYAGSAARFGLLDKNQASIESYVTQKALDGLFLMMAQEERAIRQNPVGQASSIIQKVFGALRTR